MPKQIYADIYLKSSIYAWQTEVQELRQSSCKRSLAARAPSPPFLTTRNDWETSRVSAHQLQSYSGSTCLAVTGLRIFKNKTFGTIRNSAFY